VVNVIKDKREWQVQPILDNDDCPYLYYPGNIHGCKYNDPKQLYGNECDMDTCPIRIKPKRYEKLAEAIDFLEEMECGIRFEAIPDKEYEWNVVITFLSKDFTAPTMLEACKLAKQYLESLEPDNADDPDYCIPKEC